METEIFLKFKIECEIRHDLPAVRVYNLNAKKEWNSLIHNYRFHNLDQRVKWITNFKHNQQSRADSMNARKAERKTIIATPELIGKIFYDSWGYDMTLVDYLTVIAISNKTVTAVMIGATFIGADDGKGNGRVQPNANKIISDPFKLTVRPGYQGNITLRGKYPISGNSDNKRMGSFSECKATESHYYNTWD